MLDRATLADMLDADTRRDLGDLADAYEKASPRLRAAILKAARGGANPAEITRAIKHVMTYDYVARLIRQDRKDNPGDYPAAES
jgi:hypothetical protein